MFNYQRFCFSFSNFENSESFNTFLWLKEQQTPISVGTGLNSLEQSTSLPWRRHFFRRWSGPEWQGWLECHSRLNRLLWFLPISFTGKFALVRFRITSSNNLKLARVVLLKNTSIAGKLELFIFPTMSGTGGMSICVLFFNENFWALKVHWFTVMPVSCKFVSWNLNC